MLVQHTANGWVVIDSQDPRWGRVRTASAIGHTPRAPRIRRQHMHPPTRRSTAIAAMQHLRAAAQYHNNQGKSYETF